MACPFQGMAPVSASGTSQAWLAAEALRKAGIPYVNHVRDARNSAAVRS
jgi:hypothetical protein